MINKSWLEEIQKYSFINKCERVGIKYYFHYTVNGKNQFKTLPLRATGPMVKRVIDAIKNEVGVNTYGTSEQRIYGF